MKRSGGEEEWDGVAFRRVELVEAGNWGWQQTPNDKQNVVLQPQHFSVNLAFKVILLLQFPDPPKILFFTL